MSFPRILDSPGSRQYVARGLQGQVDFASISSDGFFEGPSARSLPAMFAGAARSPHAVRKDAMAEHDGGEEEDRLLRARLERLSGALEKQRKEASPRPDAANGGGSSGGSAMGLGMRAASEFAATIVVGGLIGWQLDVWLGTKPAFLIVFFMLGVVAGVWNVIRVTSPMPRKEPTNNGQAAPPPAGQGAPPGVDEDED
jgi:ATP synthase protein I